MQFNNKRSPITSKALQYRKGPWTSVKAHLSPTKFKGNHYWCYGFLGPIVGRETNELWSGKG